MVAAQSRKEKKKNEKKKEEKKAVRKYPICIQKIKTTNRIGKKKKKVTHHKIHPYLRFHFFLFLYFVTVELLISLTKTEKTISLRIQACVIKTRKRILTEIPIE